MGLHEPGQHQPAVEPGLRAIGFEARPNRREPARQDADINPPVLVPGDANVAENVVEAHGSAASPGGATSKSPTLASQMTTAARLKNK